MSRRIASGISWERAAIPTGPGSDSGRWPPARKLRTRVRCWWPRLCAGRAALDSVGRARLVRGRLAGHPTGREAGASSACADGSRRVRWRVYCRRAGSASAGGIARLGAEAPASARAPSAARRPCDAYALRSSGTVGSACDGLHTIATRDSASGLERLAVASADSAPASSAAPGMSTTFPRTPPATRS
jgi:hypothetical protein